MLTCAIGFVQNVQMICFAVALTFMALQNRENTGLRWLAAGYISGLMGEALDFGGTGCLRGWRTRWISVLLVGGALPFFSARGGGSQRGLCRGSHEPRQLSADRGIAAAGFQAGFVEFRV